MMKKKLEYISEKCIQSMRKITKSGVGPTCLEKNISLAKEDQAYRGREAIGKLQFCSAC